MKYILFILCVVSLMDCTNNTSKTTETTEDTVKLVNEIRAQRPKFKGYFEEIYDVGIPERYMQVVVNSAKLCKVSMVYFDNKNRKWETLTWIGKGEHNKVLADIKFNQDVAIGFNYWNRYEDNPTFYMATSNDEGKTWNSLDMSQVPASCRWTRRHQKAAQLILSNDFLNSTHTPSIVVIWQWNHLKHPLQGYGIAQNIDFSSFCPLLKEFPITPESYPKSRQTD